MLPCHCMCAAIVHSLGMSERVDHRRPKGRQGVHPTPWTPGRTSDPLAVHIVPRLPRKRGGDPRNARAYTSDPLAVHIVPRLPRKRGGDPRNARAYIRPIGSAHCPTPATQRRRRPKGRQGVHPTPWQCILSHACHAKEAETQGTPGRTSESGHGSRVEI